MLALEASAEPNVLREQFCSYVQSITIGMRGQCSHSIGCLKAHENILLFCAYFTKYSVPLNTNSLLYVLSAELETRLG